MTEMSNVLRATLEAEVTTIVDVLAQGLGCDRVEQDGTEADTELVAGLAEQLGRIGMAAIDYGLIGLHDVCTLFEAGLAEIAE